MRKREPSRVCACCGRAVSPLCDDCADMFPICDLFPYYSFEAALAARRVAGRGAVISVCSRCGAWHCWSPVRGIA